MKVISCTRCKSNKIQILAKHGPKGCKYNFICKCGQKGPEKETYDKAISGWNELNKTKSI